MSDALTPEEERAIAQLSDAVASQLAEGKSRENIVKELLKQEWHEDAAVQFVDNIANAMHEYENSSEGRNEIAKRYARHMIYGVLWVVGGTVVTVATYGAASEGGKYVVAWGAIVYGAIDFFRGLWGWLKYKD